MSLTFYRRHKKSLIATFLVAGCFFLIGFFYKYHLPRIESWLLIEVEKRTEQYSDLRIHPQTLSFHLFPLGLNLKNIRVLPKTKLKKIITPTTIDNIGINVAIFPLFQGQLRLSKVLIQGLDLNSLIHKDYLDRLIQTQSPQTNDEKGLDKIGSNSMDLGILKDIPIDEINLEDINLYVKNNILSQFGDATKSMTGVRARHLKIRIENRISAALVDLTLPELTFEIGLERKKIELYTQTRFLVSKSSINLTGFKLKQNRSFFVGSGYLEGDPLNFQFSSFTGKVRTQAHLADIQPLLNLFYENKIPDMSGQVLIESSLNIKKNKEPTAVFNIKTTDLKIDHFLIGSLNSRGTVDPEFVKLNTLKVTNRSGSIGVKDFSLGLKDKMPIKALVSTQNLELRKFLETINVGTTPINLDLAGELPCLGQLKNDFVIDCKGELVGKNLLVHSGGATRKTIIKINELRTKGRLKVTDKFVEYDTELAIKENKGRTKGKITYSQGFDIEYQTPKVLIQDVESIADLNMKGALEINGRTYGDSSAAEIDMSIKGEDFWLENYGLGKPKAQLQYKKGTLYFKRLRGHYNGSQYRGLLNIDLIKSRIWFNLSSNYVDAKDVKSLLSQRANIPIDLSGSGNIKISGSGPLEFNRLSYDFSGQLYRGTIAEEPYDELSFSIQSKSGFVKSKQLILKRGDSLAHMDAEVDPTGAIKAYIVGSNFRIEQLNTIKKLGLNLKGRLDSIATLSGQILDPDVFIEGHASSVLVGNEPQDESRFKLKITKGELSGVGNFIGEKIKTDFLIPFSLNKPSHFKVNTQKWDFLKLFNLVSETSVKRNYSSNINLALDISAPTGGFWNSSGQLKVNDFAVSRGELALKSKKPMVLNFNHGIISSKDFNVSDDEGNFASLSIKNLTKSNLKAKLEAQLDLGLALILTPLEELGGQLIANIDLTGSAENPQAIGNAIIKNGAVEIGGFPHPFENINADLLFSDQKIIINAARGSLGGGDLRGTGSIEFKGYKNLPIDIKGEFTNVSLEIPKDFKSKGSGNIYLSGKWFPYELGGNYNITSGSVTSEFASNNKAGSNIKPSLFLPKILAEQSFEPITLKLNIDILQPIEVKNSNTLAPITGKILITESPAYPRLNGKVVVEKGGRIQFRENEFELDSSNIYFNNSAPENPTLDISANTQLESGNITYEVNLRILGEAENPHIKLSSSPPLQELDLVSLLALGITREELDNKDAGAIATQNAYQIGSALLASPIGKQLKSKYGIDLQIGSEEVDDSSSEGSQTVPKVTIRKKINSSLEASASRTLGKAPRTNAKFEFKVNNNFSVIGFYDTIDQNESTTDSGNDEDTVGIDLEYKIQFK